MSDVFSKQQEVPKQAGLSIARKLKREHIHLDGFSRMRVDLAAQVNESRSDNSQLSKCFLLFQVLSETVACLMEFFKIPGCEETIRFIRMFDRAFDYLNVRSLTSEKPSRRGYTSEEDERILVRCEIKIICLSFEKTTLQWLENEFLSYLSEWEAWIESRGALPTAEKRTMCLSLETLTGWKISG